MLMPKQEYTTDKLMDRLRPINKPIETDGYWYAHGQYWSINYSSILTRLIQSAGRFCKDYASDLFISWEEIHKRLERENLYTDGIYEYLFGMRELGVDHTNYILSNANSSKCLEDYYREMFKLTITVNDDRIHMELIEVIP